MRLIPLAALLLTVLPVQADTLADLKAALQRLQAETPIRGQVTLKSENRNNEGKDDAEVQPGQAQLSFEDGPQGLRLAYPQTLLNKALSEDQAKDQDPKAATPTANGLRELGYKEVRELTRPAEVLSRQLARATLKGEKADSWQGKPAKLLSFELQQRRPDKYVKKYEGQLDVWVAADGTPLAARSTQKISGRAMVVISFEMNSQDEWHFAVSGERLVVTRKLTTGSGSGAGEKGQQRREFALQLS
ncbi:hypothetical protein [Inhella proteolytica]|uniref:Outer membrane lipoprotein carrier protein LolA n=1 Tax=Inhella proteolytica TaxID=2795029 RepID=A0A931NIR4_9BURK|nr:hypothetical protein [Inhella proteolytica]MBH9579138.1 hypothetical protein [Inhella proteolytica]